VDEVELDFGGDLREKGVGGWGERERRGERGRGGGGGEREREGSEKCGREKKEARDRQRQGRKELENKPSYLRRLVLEAVPGPDVDDGDSRREVGAEEALFFLRRWRWWWWWWWRGEEKVE